ncbi:hypothetical protein GCM10010246_52010 [Streptomyces cuspidosporus]|uniref:Uncharacterized protein n=1 Tax=Streptomyces cuspidosporus TaxID=66882 RepID=A0ABP5TMB5_9ACTN
MSAAGRQRRDGGHHDRPRRLHHPRLPTQNLSYSRASGRLWGHNEWTGHRVVFSIDPP